MKPSGLICSLIRLFLLLVVAGGARTAHAGRMYVFLVVDPGTTAGYGIPAVNGGYGAGATSLRVVSNRSGPGTWHLYAVDDVTDSYGIRTFNVKLSPGSSGTIPAIENRSPSAFWDDNEYFSDGTGPFGAGFNDNRSSFNVNPISGGQAVANIPQIGGLGMLTSNFQAKTGAASYAISISASGQWGRYSNDDIRNPIKSPLFLAEGTYTGAPPTVDLTTPSSQGGTAVSVWTDAALTQSASATQLNSVNPLACFDCVYIADASIENVNASNPGSVSHTFGLYSLTFSPPITWYGFDFVSYQPAPGASGTGPAAPATFDPSTRVFNWNTIGSQPGLYKWQVEAQDNFGYFDIGYITVNVSAVPEPVSLISLAILLIGAILLRKSHLRS
jgi:hypothetical protein